MKLENDFVINRYDFNSTMFGEFHNIHYAKDLWPIVYILSDGTIKEAYVGETTDTYARMNNHLKNNANIEVPHIIEVLKMLKYVFAWLLGVPLGLLVLIYLVSHAF